MTGYIGVGDRIQLTQSNTNYFIVTAISVSAGVTTITLFGGVVPIVLTAAHAHSSGAVTSIACTALPASIASGQLIYMPNGDTPQINGAPAAGATTINLISSTPGTALTGWNVNDTAYAPRYFVGNSTISTPMYSHVKNPYGFNADPEFWTLISGSTSYVSVGNPTSNTWYATGQELAVPIGVWEEELEASLYVSGSNSVGQCDMLATAAASQNAQDDVYFTVGSFFLGSATYTTGAATFDTLTCKRRTSRSAGVTLWMNMSTTASGASMTIGLYGTAPFRPHTITARCGYL